MSKEDKLERLLRYHRQRVFGPSGDAHSRAIGRLKKTVTFREMTKKRADDADYRRSQKILHLWQ